MPLEADQAVAYAPALTFLTGCWPHYLRASSVCSGLQHRRRGPGPLQRGLQRGGSLRAAGHPHDRAPHHLLPGMQPSPRPPHVTFPRPALWPLIKSSALYGMTFAL